MHDETELIIPDYDPYNPKPYPGDIKPGYYSQAKVKRLLKKPKDNPGTLIPPGHAGGIKTTENTIINFSDTAIGWQRAFYAFLAD